MSNWIEENQTKSVISYTLLVAGATWAVSTFILEDNRLNDYRSQVESERARAETIQARLNVVESENGALREENLTYLQLMSDNEGFLPIAEQTITELRQERESIRAELEQARAELGLPGLASYIVKIEVGEAHQDPSVNYIFSVLTISTNNKAVVNIDFPDGSSQAGIEVTAGSKWDFSHKDTNYRIVITKIAYIGGYVDIRLTKNVNK